MNTTSKLIIFGLLSMITLPSVAQTKVILLYSDDTEETFQLSDTGKLYFSGANLMIDEANGTITSVSLTDIRKVNFKSLTESISDKASLSYTTMKLYPNPANEYIQIANLSESSVTVSIYNIMGKLLLKKQYSADEMLDVSSLPSGLYIIKINEQTLKFSKL